jgi:hypothetical protein
MYLGETLTLGARLAATEDAIAHAKRALSLEGATYVGTLRASGADPSVWGELDAALSELQSGLSVWTHKLRDLKAVEGRAAAPAWNKAAEELITNGDKLVAAVATVNKSLKRRFLVSRILGNIAASIKIIGGTALIDIPKLAVERTTAGLRATRGLVKEAGGILQEAGSAVGGTLGNITGPVKTILLVGAGVAALYFLWPVLKGAGAGMEAKAKAKTA